MVSLSSASHYCPSVGGRAFCWTRGHPVALGALGAQTSADISLHAGLEPRRRRPAAAGGQTSFKCSSNLKNGDAGQSEQEEKLSQCVWSPLASAPIKNKAHF